MELTLNPSLNGIDFESYLWVYWLNLYWNGIDIDFTLNSIFVFNGCFFFEYWILFEGLMVESVFEWNSH